MDIDLGPIKQFSRIEFTKITLSPTLKNLGTHIVKVTIRDRDQYKPIGNPFRFGIEVVAPLRPPEFSCLLGRKVKCLPKIESVSNNGLMVIRFPLGLYTFNETQYAIIAKSINLSLKFADDLENGGTLSSNSSLTSWEVKKVT